MDFKIMYKLIRETKGFTLTELLIAVLLMSVIALGVTSINVSSRRFLISAGHQANAQSEARFAMEHMMRNIREGDNVITVSSNDIRIRMPFGWPYDWIRYQRTVSDELEYSYQGAGAAETIATGVVDNPGGIDYFLELTPDVLITITITARDRDEEATLTSNVTLRN